MIVLQAAGAFLISSALLFLTLTKSIAPNTSHFLCKCRYFWITLIVYGAIASLILIILGTSTGSGSIDVQGVNVSNPVTRTVLAGTAPFFFRALVSTVAVVPDTIISGGLQSSDKRWWTTLRRGAALVFDQIGWLEHQAERCHRLQLWKYVQDRVDMYPSFEDALQRIEKHLPAGVPKAAIAAFKGDLRDPEETPNTDVAMGTFMVHVGKEIFDSAFPPKDIAQ